MFHLVVNQRFFRQLLSSDMAHTRASQGAANERMESGDDGDEIYKHFHRKHQFFKKKVDDDDELRRSRHYSSFHSCMRLKINLRDSRLGARVHGRLFRESR